MTVTLGLNISALRAQNQLARSSSELSDVFTRLSSGQRINSASDDAAGLAISESLNSDSRVLQQAVRNTNDGISLLNIAESALSEANNILQRLEELSIQAANGTYSDEQRNALDVEAQALSEEFSRILNSTEFNGKSLFSTEPGGTHLQIGLRSSDSLNIEFRDETVITEGDGTYNDETFDEFGSSPVSGPALAIADFDSDGLDDVVYAQLGSSAGSTDIYGGVVIGSGGSSFAEIDTFNVSTTAGVSPGNLYIGITDYGNDGDLDIIFQSDSGAPGYTIGENDGSANFTFTSYTAGTLIGSGGTTSATANFNNDGVDDLATVSSSGSVVTLTMSVQNTQDRAGYESLELDTFSLQTASEALTAKGIFTTARDSIQELLGNIGATQSRLGSIITLNESTSEQYLAARSRIIDADIAAESARMIRFQILQQAGAAILGQANLQPQLALQLLRE